MSEIQDVNFGTRLSVRLSGGPLNRSFTVSFSFYWLFIYYFCVLSFTIFPEKRIKNLELDSPCSYPQKFCRSRSSREAIFLYWVYSLAVEVRQRWRSPLKVNLVLSREDMCLLQIWKTKQNKTKKKSKKETIKRFSLRKKKTKQQQQQKPEYCRFIAVSWFRASTTTVIREVVL